MLLRMYSGSSIQVKRTLESVVKVIGHMMSRLVLFQRKIPYLHPLQYPLPEIAFFVDHFGVSVRVHLLCDWNWVNCQAVLRVTAPALLRLGDIVGDRSYHESFD